MEPFDTELTEERALRAYARMINTLDLSHLEPLLPEDFHYASQMVLHEITSKQEFLAYIRPKLEAFASIPQRTRAEMAVLGSGSQGEPGPGMVVLGYAYRGRPCVVVSQGDINQPEGTVLAGVSGGKLQRLDMCIVPNPSSARRSGEFPE